MDDLISRQAAIDCEYQVKIINDIEYVMLSEVQMKMRKLPSSQPERKKGKWLKAYGDHEAFGVRPFYRYCSACNESTVFPYNYCPNCGADMRGEQDE